MECYDLNIIAGISL